MPPTGRGARDGARATRDWVTRAVTVLRRGGLVAFPTDTVYGLGADIFNPLAIERLFAVKGRSAGRAVPVLLGDAGDASLVAAGLSEQAMALARAFWPGPLTLVVRRNAEVPGAAAGGGDTIGIRVPDHEVPRAIVRALGRPITGTSANSSGLPPHRDARGVEGDIGAQVDLVVPGECGRHSRPSTVVDCTRTPPTVLRAGAISLEELRAVCPDAANPGACIASAGGKGAK